MKRQIAALSLAGILALGGIVGCAQKPAEPAGEQQTEEAAEGAQQTETTTAQTNAKDSTQGSSGAANVEHDEYVPQWSAADCTANALAAVGAGNSAKNVTTSDLIEGGGTFYYLVEFDLDAAHYRVQVDATNGVIIDVMESVDGKVQQYNEDGTVTEVEV